MAEDIVTKGDLKAAVKMLTEDIVAVADDVVELKVGIAAIRHLLESNVKDVAAMRLSLESNVKDVAAMRLSLESNVFVTRREFEPQVEDMRLIKRKLAIV
ncbi:MAG: hypothetical protein HW383_205 [Candidatus Magasanikbacteria bacterium]|nr:hypothetical protein [Candidatus Magasanikbacteria bacterium]